LLYLLAHQMIPHKNTWVLQNQKWIHGPDLAVGSYGGCFSKSSWTKEEYLLIGGNTKPDHELSDAILQHFSNGTWTLLADQTLSKNLTGSMHLRDDLYE